MFSMYAQYEHTSFLWYYIHLACLSVSGQGKQKWSDMRKRTIKWDGKQKGIDDICCEFLINYMDEIMVLLFSLPCNLS